MNKKFLWGVGVFLILVLVFELQAPHRFIWNATFRHHDPQPFGCYVFDSLLTVSMPKGYSVTDKTVYQLEQDHANAPLSVLLVTETLKFTKTDRDALLRLLNRGCNVLVVAANIHYEYFTDTLKIGCMGYEKFNLQTVQQYVRQGTGRDTLSWVAAGTDYVPRSYSCLSSMVSGIVVDRDSVGTRLLERKKKGGSDDSKADLGAVAKNVGKGTLYLCSYPYLFTNYGILEGNNHELLCRLLSPLGQAPVVRTEAYLPDSEESSQTPLRYFLDSPPLRWMIYTLLAGLLLFFIFTARRRQRVIPVMKTPENKNVEFVELIGTLYHQQHDNRDLVMKKYLYFNEVLRRQLLIDLDETDERHWQAQADMLAEHVGMDLESMRQRLRHLRQAVQEEGRLKDRDMRRLIDDMDEILKQI